MAYKVIRSTGDYRLYLTLSKGTPNIAGNYTPVTVRLYLYKNTGTNWQGLYTSNSSTWSWSGTGITARSGSYVLDFRSPKDNYGEILLRNETFNVAHNSDGSRGNLTVNATVNFAHTYFPSSVSISESVSFTTIPRASTISLSGATQSNANIDIAISRKSNSFTHHVWYRVTGGSWVTVATAATTSATFKVQPSEFVNSKTTTVEVSVQTKSGTTNIGDEVRATRAISVPNSTISVSGTANTGSAQTASVSNSGGTGLTHTLSWSLGSATAGNSTSWTPPHSALPTATSGTLTATVTTKNGTAVINTASATRTVSVPASIVPTLGGISQVEYVDAVKSLSLGEGYYVQGKSRITLTITGASGGDGTSGISSYSISGQGIASSSSTGTTGVLSSSGSSTYTATVTDSRGRTASRSITVEVRPYAPPKISSYTVNRSNSAGTVDTTGTFARVVHSALATTIKDSAGVEKNKIRVIVKTKPSNSSTWTQKSDYNETGLTSSRAATYSGYATTQDYDVAFDLYDIFGLYTSITGGALYIPTAGANLFIGSRGLASSFGKLPTYGKNYDLEVGLKGMRVDGPLIGKNGDEVLAGGDILNIVYPVGSIYISTSSTNPASLFGGTWVAFGQGRTLVGVDSGQTEFNTVQKTGGHKSLQEHTHTVSGTAASAGAHTHTVSGTAASNGAHAHVLNNNPSGYNLYAVDQTKAADGWTWGYGGSNNYRQYALSKVTTGTAGAHTHTVSGTAASAGAHTHTISGTTASTGGGDAQNLQPYITVYMWRRTA